MRERDVLVVGAGFTGLALLDRLRALGYDAEPRKAGDGPGSTWHQNRDDVLDRGSARC